MLGEFLNELVTNRAERLHSEQSIGFMERAWAKNSAAWLAVISSWCFFLSIYPQNTWDGVMVSLGSAIHAYSFVAMVISLGLLRRSSGRVNKLNDELLDEREIVNRDWAYKTGYLVVRSVGLGLMILLCVVWVANEAQRGVPVPGDPGPLDNFSKFLAFYFQENAILATIQLLGLLTYVAYTFPMILLAWRQAKAVDLEYLKEQEVRAFRLLAASIARRYFARLKVLAGLLVGLIAFWILVNVLTPAAGYSSSFLPGIFFGMLFGVVFYGVWVFAIGMFNQGFMIRVLERVPGVEGLKPVTKTLFNQFLSMSIIGSLMLTIVVSSMVSLPVLPVIASIGLPVCFLGGLILLSIHLASFGAIRALGAVETKN